MPRCRIWGCAVVRDISNNEVSNQVAIKRKDSVMTGEAQLNRSIGRHPIKLRGIHLLTALLLAGFAAMTGSAHSQSFTISGPQSPVPTWAGGTAISYPITITIPNGSNPGAVTLQASNVPSGISVSVPPCWTSQPASGSTCNLTVLAASTVAGGSYSFTVTGTPSSGSSSSITTGLWVESFSISALPTALTVPEGGNGTTTITNTENAGPGEANVSLTSSGQPSTVQISFSVNPLQPVGPQSVSTMTVSASPTTTPGTYPITVTGTVNTGNGTLIRTATVTVTVTSNPSFAVSWTPTQAQQGFDAGTCETVGYTVTPYNGFNSPVNITAGSSESGLTGTVNSSNSTVMVCATTAVPGGEYPITLTGTGGGFTETATWQPFIYNFTISALPTSISVSPGSSGTSTITVVDPPGPGSPQVSFLATGQPPQATVSFSPSTLSANPNPVNSTMTVTVPSGTTAGTYPIAVTGTMNGGGPSYSPVVTLTVPIVGSFAISWTTTQSNQSVNAGNCETVGYIITPSGGFNGSVNVTVSSAQAGLTGIVNSANSTVNVCATTSVPGGQYPLTITGTAGSMTSSASWQLWVVNFSISASPTTIYVSPGSTATSTVAVNEVAGPGGVQVGLSATGQPSGATVSFNPSTTNYYNGIEDSNMNVQVPAGTALGTYPITVTGTTLYQASSEPTQITTVNLVVGLTPTISLTSSPTPSTSGSTVTLKAAVTNGDTNSVTFYNGSTSLGTAIPSNGTATLTTSSLPVGPDILTATIAPGGSYIPATSSPITQTVVVPLSITTTSLPAGTQNSAYSTTLQETGGQPPYIWSTSGSVPDGLSLNGSTGAITGTPMWSGTDSITVVVTDSSNATSSATLSISVGSGGAPNSASSVTYTYDSQGRVYTAKYTTPNGTITVTYSYDSAGNRTSVVTQ